LVSIPDNDAAANDEEEDDNEEDDDYNRDIPHNSSSIQLPRE
jgi:hypothetical protein